MDVLEWLGQSVRGAVAALQAAGRLPAGLDLAAIGIEAPQKRGRGDFACNAALVLGPQVAMPPGALAALLAQTLTEGEALVDAEVAGPGFLNLRLAPALWARMLTGLLQAGPGYGAGRLGQGQRMGIGFIPLDPHDDRPLSPARREAVGTALANLLDHAGFRTNRPVAIEPGEGDRTVRLGPLLGVKGRGAAAFAGRRGDDLDLAEIAAVIGEDATRLGLLMQPASAPLELDLDRLADPSHANAVFHLHYAHARCCDLRRRGEGVADEVFDRSYWDISAFEDEGARLILRLLALYPGQIDLAVGLDEPYRLVQHLHGLADALHRQYYRSLGAPYLRFIRDDDRLLTGARLALVRGVETVLKSGLDLLGSTAPDEMR